MVEFTLGDYVITVIGISGMLTLLTKFYSKCEFVLYVGM